MKPITTALLITALQLLPLQDVEQEAGEEGAGAERDHGEVQVDPEPEREAVVHVGLVEAEGQAEVRARRDRAPSSATHGASQSRKLREGGAVAGRAATSRSSMVPPVGRRGPCRRRSASRRTQSRCAAVVDLRARCPRRSSSRNEPGACAARRATSLAGSSRSPKRDRRGRAGLDAGRRVLGRRLRVAAGGRLPVAGGLQAVAAEGALLDDAARARRDLGVQRLRRAGPASPGPTS